MLGVILKLYYNTQKKVGKKKNRKEKSLFMSQLQLRTRVYCIMKTPILLYTTSGKLN